jgi:hypothetical protein
MYLNSSEQTKPVIGVQRCSHVTPRADKGVETFDYYVGDVDVVCHLDYSPAERGSRERGTGLQLEPDYDARADLLAVYVRDVDVITMLSDDQIADIEEAFLCQDRDDF